MVNVEFSENVFLVYAPDLRTTKKEKNFFTIEKDEQVKQIKLRLAQYFEFNTPHLKLIQCFESKEFRANKKRTKKEIDDEKKR